jgi:hypothetical protein
VWQRAETNTHQDHVIAHVIGATVTGHFVWDETAYLLLDIGFIWNIYLDGEMGLVPQTQAIAELEADNEMKTAVRADVDAISLGSYDSLQRVSAFAGSPIESVDFLVWEHSRMIKLNCEESTLMVETSLETTEVKIYEQ